MNNQLIAVPDSHHYWKVVRVSDGAAIMTALEEAHAKRWAARVSERDSEGAN